MLGTPAPNANYCAIKAHSPAKNPGAKTVINRVSASSLNVDPDASSQHHLGDINSSELVFTRLLEIAKGD